MRCDCCGPMGVLCAHGSPFCRRWPAPPLVLKGEESMNREFIDLKMASSAIPQSTCRMVGHAGHLIPMEKPKLTLEIIEEFFGSP